MMQYAHPSGRWVDFDIGGGVICRGFEGLSSPVPIDKAAELVLSFGTMPPTTIKMTVDPIYGGDLEWTVVATSEIHVGGTGRTVAI
jgi:hypothetical protein